MIRSLRFWTASTLLFLVGTLWGEPPSREWAEHREKFILNLKAALLAEMSVADKVAAINRAYKSESSSDIRRVVFEFIPAQPDAAIDRFLIGVLTGDEDACTRGLAAKALGKHGTEQCLPALTKAASSDEVTDFRMGCIVGKGTARRSATFAIAELASRHPKLVDKASEALRELKPTKDDAKDTESLADARVQALYQVTREDKLLEPFLERLQSKDAKVRESGVLAFQFFKLKTAPPELVKRLSDVDASVRSWAALTLGEIGDLKTVPALAEQARDSKQNVGSRCNAIHALGRMKAVESTGLMRKLLSDEAQEVQVQAAIALYRLTGERVKQLPTDYGTE